MTASVRRGSVGVGGVTGSGGLSTKTSNRIGNAIAHTILLTGSVAMAGPFLWMVLSSLKTQWEIYRFPPTIFPSYPQWSNYTAVFKDRPFGLYIGNSLYIALLVTLGVVFTSSLAGYSFARVRFPGRDKIFLAYLSTMMIPGSVTLIPRFIMMRAFGWLDTHVALIVPGLVGAWGTFMMRQFMLTIPRELEDAALIDGCSRFRIYWNIILPVSQPVLATLGIFTFMGSWNSFLWPVIMLNREKLWTLPIGLAMFQSRYASRTPWHLVMAASFISVAPIMILFMAGQKYYVQGIVTTGIKGVA